MKKIYTTLLLLVMSVCAFAQSNEGRLLVTETNGNVKGFLLERVDSVYFDLNDYGRVAADVAFDKYSSGATGDTLWLSVTRTPSCEGYRIDVLQKNLADLLGTADRFAAQLEYYGSPMYYQDFELAQMTGFEFDFVPDAEYTVVTVGYDRYGIACTASRAEFRTPALPVEGNPVVDYTIDEVGPFDITMSFKPNEDVSEYYFCLFKKGEAQMQFDMFAPMFGLANIGDMIKMWGIPCSGDFTYTYTGQEPSTDYEIYIQPLDIYGANAPIIVADVRTADLGGDGPAEVSISIGEFGGDAETGYYQYVTFTPNENVSLYRAMLIEKAAYETEDWGDAGVIAYLQQDNDSPWWNLYKEDNAPWNVDPNTEYYAFALGQNAKGEWGALARVEFKTPDVGAAPATVPAKVAKRVNKPGTVLEKGFSPINKVFNNVPKVGKGIQLIQQ